jgi:hypothetical protein
VKTCPDGQQHTFGLLVVGCSVRDPVWWSNSAHLCLLMVRCSASLWPHDSPRGLGTCCGGRIQRILRSSSGRMQRGDLFRWPDSARSGSSGGQIRRGPLRIATLNIPAGVIIWSDSMQASRKWRSQLDESAVELDYPIASRRAKPDTLTLNPSTRRLFSHLRWSDSAQGIRKLGYDVQRKREDRALCPTILQRNSAWA